MFPDISPLMSLENFVNLLLDMIWALACADPDRTATKAFN